MLPINHTANNIFCIHFHISMIIRLLVSVITPLCGFMVFPGETFMESIYLPDFTLIFLGVLILNICFWICLCVFTVGLRMEDSHRHGGGRVEGCVHQQQLFGSGEGGRERRQLFESDVGRQSGVQGQHWRYDAVGQQAFWLYTKHTKTSYFISCIFTQCSHSDDPLLWLCGFAPINVQTAYVWNESSSHVQQTTSFVEMLHRAPLCVCGLNSLGLSFWQKRIRRRWER